MARSRMSRLSGKSAEKANEILEDKELDLLKNTSIGEIKKYSPLINEEAVYNRLIPLVEEFSKGNLTVAAFKSKISDLGGAGIEIVSKIIGEII